MLYNHPSMLQVLEWTLSIFWLSLKASLELWHPWDHKFTGQCSSELTPTAAPQNTFRDSPSDWPLLLQRSLAETPSWILVDEEFAAKRGCLQLGASHLSEQHHRSSLQWIPLVLDSMIIGHSFQLGIFRDCMVLRW